jgi:hypothetical protein
VRLAVAIGALVVSAGGPAVTVLPRPAFPGPAAAPGGPHRLALVSSSIASPGGDSGWTGYAPSRSFRGAQLQQVVTTANRQFAYFGTDGATVRYVVASTKAGRALYAFDFKTYGRPPRIEPGERELVYEQPTWAQEAGGTLYVETAHSTYASSSYNRNGYVTAIDLATKRAVWRSPALVANASTFLVTKRYLVTGYGFTSEPDYLYLLARGSGKLVDRLPLPNAPERITWKDGLVHVRTYDHNVLVRLRGS